MDTVTAASPQAERLYDAERWLSPGWLVPDVDFARAHVDQITSAATWAQMFPDAPTSIRVTANHFRSGYYVGRANRRTTTLSLASNGRYAWTERLLLHELAHFAAGRGGHGPVFVAAYLRILETFTTNPLAAAAGYDPGREQRERLLVGLVRGGLHPGPVPLDLACAVDPALDDAEVCNLIENAFFNRAAAHQRSRRREAVPS